MTQFRLCPQSTAKARPVAERPVWNVEVGGSGGYGWMGTCGPRTGDRQISSGGGSGGGAYRTLPYAAAMVRLLETAEYSLSTPNMGVSE